MATHDSILLMIFLFLHTTKRSAMFEFHSRLALIQTRLELIEQILHRILGMIEQLQIQHQQQHRGLSIV